MKSTFFHFLLKLTAFTALLIVGSFVLFKSISKTDLFSEISLLFTYFFFLNAAIYYVLVKSAKKNPQVFVVRFMASTVVKLFLSLAIICVYIYLNRETAVAFVLAFFSLYALYTIFEIIVLISHFKKQGAAKKSHV
ncbi:MAG: hypothetical protein COA57_03605 [Flavobacteriales bacterium]|nr:MAG: hypothetical protein COA57_03605 [Flavobacteriales bacterium]